MEGSHGIVTTTFLIAKDRFLRGELVSFKRCADNLFQISRKNSDQTCRGHFDQVKDVDPITVDQYQLLAGIPIRERMELYSDKPRMEDILQIRVGSRVKIVKSSQMLSKGTVTCVSLNKKSGGTEFTIDADSGGPMRCNGAQVELCKVVPASERSRVSNGTIASSGEAAVTTTKLSEPSVIRTSYDTWPSTSTKIIEVSEENPFGEYCSNGVITPNELAFTADRVESVDVMHRSVRLYHLDSSDWDCGCVGWFGTLTSYENLQFVGVSMKQARKCFNNGDVDYQARLTCGPHSGLFIPVGMMSWVPDFNEYQVMLTTTFEETSPTELELDEPHIIEGMIPPKVFEADATTELRRLKVGKNRGIQGRNNSCYLDSLLVAMFMFRTPFDAVLHRDARRDDEELFKSAQRILRDEVVNPLRKENYVKSVNVNHLRTVIAEFTHDESWISQEKECGEVLDKLLHDILHMPHLIKFEDGDGSNVLTLVDLLPGMAGLPEVPTVQDLFDMHYKINQTKFKTAPKCLIIQMPRDKRSHSFQRVIPSLRLDITSTVVDVNKNCIHGETTKTHSVAQPAVLECLDCAKDNEMLDIPSIFYCKACFNKRHIRSYHRPKPVPILPDINHKLILNLFAVVCIESSHYNTYLKTGLNEGAPWVLHDSMAHREFVEGRGQVCVPEVHHLASLPKLLSERDAGSLRRSRSVDASVRVADKQDVFTKRLLKHAFYCFYAFDDLEHYS